MRVTVVTLSDEPFVMDVHGDLDLHTFKIFCAAESGILVNNMMIKYQGVTLLDETKSLQSYGINDGDIVTIESSSSKPASVEKEVKSSASTVLEEAITSLDFSSIEIPETVQKDVAVSERSNYDPEYLKDLVMSNPQQLSLLKQNNPALADAAVTGNIENFRSILNSQLAERDRKVQRYKHLLEADPYDPEAQQMIAEEIRMENIDANMEAAMEHIPESFGVVVMLYINCVVNGVPVKAFIDSGAQATLMSIECAKRCNIMRLVDTRWAGVAKGVGVQKILGRVHMTTIVIENDHLTTSFSVLEQPVDMLFGLDMLRRHQCCIDLTKNVLHIGTTGTETRFLTEAELPPWAKLSHAKEDKSEDGDA